MKKFNEFVNEGVRDLMTGKSEEEIRKSLGTLSPKEKFYKAVEYNLVWLAKEAIDEGFDLKKEINHGGYHGGLHALQTALNKGYMDIVKFLVEKGVIIRDDDLNNQLSGAVSGNKLEIAKYLIELGATIDNDYNENNAIDNAINNNNVEMLELLLDIVDEDEEVYFDEEWFHNEIINNNIKPDVLKLMTQRVPRSKEIVEEIIKKCKKTLEILNKSI